MYWDLGVLSAVGALRALLSVPLEHPFDYLKTRKQQNLGKSVFTILRTDIASNGLKQIYRGASVNAVRETIRYSYRFPAMVTLPLAIENHTSLSYTQSSIAAGLTIAVAECTILCPLERVKIWRMTSPYQSSLGAFFHYPHLRAQLYKGLKPLLVRQIVSWTTFLGANSYSRHQFPVIQDGKVSIAGILGVSLATSAVNIVCVMPLDFIKTHSQKYDQAEHSMLRVLLDAVKQQYTIVGKVRVAYSGSTVRLTHYLLHSFLTTPLLETFEVAMRRKWYAEKRR